MVSVFNPMLLFVMIFMFLNILFAKLEQNKFSLSLKNTETVKSLTETEKQLRSRLYRFLFHWGGQSCKKTLLLPIVGKLWSGYGLIFSEVLFWLGTFFFRFGNRIFRFSK